MKALRLTEEHGILALARALDVNCAFVFVDASGIIRSWNRAAELTFGHAADEAIGMKADIIVPPELREAHWQGFHRAVAASWPGSPGWGPIEPLHRAGHSVALDVLLIGVHAVPGAPLTGIVAMFRRRECDKDALLVGN